MSALFLGCSVFNQNISQWNVSRVTNMCCMFYGCTHFNQDISTWNTANVVNMRGMFYQALPMSHTILLKWNTEKVTNLSEVFKG